MLYSQQRWDSILAYIYDEVLEIDRGGGPLNAVNLRLGVGLLLFILGFRGLFLFRL